MLFGAKASEEEDE